MAEEEGNQEEKFDFTAEGEALGYISMAQARLLAMQTARETPGDYGRRSSGVSMVFAIVESGEDDDYYNVILDVRPSGDFAGTSGREQFFITKEGEVALRQVLSPPRSKGGSLLPIVIGGFAVIAGALGIGVVVLIDRGFFPPLGSPLAPIPAEIPVAVVVRTDTPVPTSTPTPTPVPATSTLPPTPTSTPTPTPTATAIPTPTSTAPPPTPSAYTLTINGATARKARTVCQGLGMLKVNHGAVMFRPLPGLASKFPTNTLVMLEAYPNEAGSLVGWSGVDSYIGNTATVLIDGNKSVGVLMVPSVPTKTPRQGRTPPPGVNGALESISQPCFTPGKSRNVTVVFKNTGTEKTHFRISVDSISSGWHAQNTHCPRSLTTCVFEDIEPGVSFPVTYSMLVDSPGVGTATWRLDAAHTCGFFGCRYVEVDRRSQRLAAPTP